MSVFDVLAATVMADPNQGEMATYYPVSADDLGGVDDLAAVDDLMVGDDAAVKTVRVILTSPAGDVDLLTGSGGGNNLTIQLAVADVAIPEIEDMFDLSGTRYAIAGEPILDTAGIFWLCPVMKRDRMYHG